MQIARLFANFQPLVTTYGSALNQVQTAELTVEMRCVYKFFGNRFPDSGRGGPLALSQQFESKGFALTVKRQARSVAAVLNRPTHLQVRRQPPNGTAADSNGGK